MIAGIAQLPRDALRTQMIGPSMLMHTCTGIIYMLHTYMFPFVPHFSPLTTLVSQINQSKTTHCHHDGYRMLYLLLLCESRAKLYDENQQRAIGMVHLRQSVHNPNIALNMQSYVPGGCKSMAKDLHERYREICQVAKALICLYI